MVEVLSGVAAGEVVVVGGLERMGEGLPVAPRPAAAPTQDTGSPAPATKRGG